MVAACTQMNGGHELAYCTERVIRVLERVKLALRLKTNAFDDEITDIIAACVHDLSIAGVNASSTLPPESTEPVEEAPEPPAPEIAPLIIRAVILYAKAEFGNNNPDAEKYRDAYIGLKTYLSIAAIGGDGV